MNDELCRCGHHNYSHWSVMGTPNRRTDCCMGGCDCKGYTPAAPSISDEAEAREDRVTDRLKNHDPAELNTLASIVTGNAGKRHPLFSVRYGIAVAILESGWLAEKLAGVWDAGHDCCINEVPGDCPGGLNHTNPFRAAARQEEA